MKMSVPYEKDCWISIKWNANLSLNWHLRLQKEMFGKGPLSWLLDSCVSLKKRIRIYLIFDKYTLIICIVQAPLFSPLQSRHHTQQQCTPSVAYSGSTTRRCVASAPAKAEEKALRHLVPHAQSKSLRMLCALHTERRTKIWSTRGDAARRQNIKDRRVNAVARAHGPNCQES